MEFNIIKTENQYNQYLERLDALFDAPLGTKESDEADILALIIEDYEAKHYPIESPDPIEAIKIRMEEMNLKQKDLIDELGTKSRVSEVLNKKRKLTVEMIRKLAVKLQISSSILIGDYHLVK